MSETILKYNFESTDVADGDFAALYEKRRRDALFAYAFRKEGYLYALRDHLGNVPLFYIHKDGKFQFATALNDLTDSGMQLSPPGITTYLSFFTAKLTPPVEGVAVVPPGTVLRMNEADGSVEVIYRYTIQPVDIPALTRLSYLVWEVEKRFLDAMQRQLKAERVGLYLSGGMDSGIIGVFLKRLGVQVHAYTSAPWGKTSSEIPFALRNAEIVGVDRHEIDSLESDQYRAAMRQIPALYGQPHGSTTGVGVANLWMNTGIEKETQIFFGQNSDTMTCSVPLQYLVYFLSYLPRPLQNRLARAEGDVLTLYLSLFSKGLLHDYLPLESVVNRTDLSRMQCLSMAGMYIVHSQADGEVLAQPAIRRNIPVANPYYDLDLIEFCLGIPFMNRVQVSRHNDHLLSLEKRVLRQFAVKYLPREIVYRKKAFTVALSRDAETQQLAEEFPQSIGGIQTNWSAQRFAAEVLRQWCFECGIDPN
jgi:asparagine synthetase B (glutamine-hydrolysing)